MKHDAFVSEPSGFRGDCDVCGRPCTLYTGGLWFHDDPPRVPLASGSHFNRRRGATWREYHPNGSRYPS